MSQSLARNTNYYDSMAKLSENVYINKINLPLAFVLLCATLDLCISATRRNTESETAKTKPSVAAKKKKKS